MSRISFLRLWHLSHQPRTHQCVHRSSMLPTVPTPLGYPPFSQPPLTCLAPQLGLRPVSPEQMPRIVEEPLAALACQAGLYSPALSLAAWGACGEKRVPRFRKRKGLLHPVLPPPFSSRDSTPSPPRFDGVRSLHKVCHFLGTLYLSIWLCRVLVAAREIFVAACGSCGIFVAACGI